MIINRLIIFFNLVVVLICAAGYYFFDFYPSKYFIIIGLAVVLTSTIVFSIRVEPIFSLKRQIFKHSTFAILGLIVVNFQAYFDYVLGYAYHVNSFDSMNSQTITNSLLLSVAGLSAFYFGFLIYKINKNKFFIGKKSEGYAGTYPLTVVYLVFLVLYLYNVNPKYLLGGYGRFEMGLDAIYYSYLVRVSFFAIIIQSIINSRVSNSIIGFASYAYAIGYTNLIITVIYLLSVVVSGDRGDLISFILLVLFGYIVTCNVKVGLLKGVGIIFAGAVLISLLGDIRSYANQDSSLYSRLSAILSESKTSENVSIVTPTFELSKSIKALNYSVESIPEKYDFMYGRLQVQSIISVLPFAGTLFNYLYDDNSEKYNSSDSYVTWLIQGDNSTSGDGTSVVADFYISFGFIGVVIGMAIYGWLIRHSEVNFSANDYSKIMPFILSAVLFCMAIYMARSSLFSIIRLVVWIYIFVKLNLYANNILRVGK